MYEICNSCRLWVVVDEYREGYQHIRWGTFLFHLHLKKKYWASDHGIKSMKQFYDTAHLRGWQCYSVCAPLQHHKRCWIDFYDFEKHSWGPAQIKNSNAIGDPSNTTVKFDISGLGFEMAQKHVDCLIWNWVHTFTCPSGWIVNM